MSRFFERRANWLVPAVAAVGVLAALLVPSLWRADLYAAEVSIATSPDQVGQVRLSTYAAQLVHDRGGAVRAVVSGVEPSAVEIEVQPNDAAGTLAIRVRHRSPQVAAAVANELADRLVALVAAKGGDEFVHIVDEAAIASDPSSDVDVRSAALSTALTFIVAALVVRSWGESRRSDGGPPNVDPLDHVVVERAPHSAAAAAFVALADQLEAGMDERPRSVAVVGDGPNDPSADVALNLAVVFGHRGRRVVLADTDSSVGSVASSLGLPIDAVARLVPSSGAPIECIAITPDIEAAADWLDDRATTDDLVIVHVPSLQSSEAALEWAAVCDAVVAVTSGSHGDEPAVIERRLALEHRTGGLLAVVAAGLMGTDQTA